MQRDDGSIGVLSMTSKQRVIKVFNLQKADRIPRYEMFLPSFIDRWAEKYGNLRFDSIYDFYGKIDIGTVLADQYGPFFSRRKIEKRDGNTYYERDGWGRLIKKKDDAFFEQDVENVFKEKSLLNELEFESPMAPERHEQLKEMSKRLEGRFALVSGILGLFMGACRLRGEARFLMDLIDDLPFARSLVDRLMEFTQALGLRVAEVTKTKDTALWLYDEFAGRTGPIFSPDAFQLVFLEPYKKMIAFWKSHGISHIILHCDGNSLPLFELFMEAGFSGIQSLAPTAGMWLPDVRKRWDRFILIGGMCNINTLAKGSRSDIEREVKAIVEVAKDGGVMIGTHSIDDSIPVENYDWYDAVLEKCNRNW